MLLLLLAQLDEAAKAAQVEKADRLRDIIEHFLDSVQTSKTNPIVIALLFLMLIDIITGILAAWITKEIDSAYSYRGVLKKAQMLLMVAASMMFEFIYPDIPWSKIVAGFICLTEIISITENVGKSGVPLPKQLKETLKRLREESGGNKIDVTVQAPTAKEVHVNKQSKNGDSVTITAIPRESHTPPNKEEN